MSIKYQSFLHTSGLIALCILVFFPGKIVAQNPVPAAYSTQARLSYVRTWTATAPDASASHLITRPLTDVKQFTQYYDGFGRPVETVAMQASPAGHDMVTAKCYDPSTGNEVFKYLPFTANAATTGDAIADGNFKLDPFQEQTAFYNTILNGQTNEFNVGPASNQNWAYEQRDIEPSPQNRILDDFAPGANWVGSKGSPTPHYVKTQYLLNTVWDLALSWSIGAWSVTNPEQNILPVAGAFYGGGQLYKTITTDQQGNQHIEFRDIYGQLVLKKDQLQSSSPLYTPLDDGTGKGYTGWICTYYVYDDHHNLRFVIAPNVVAQMAAANSWVVSLTQADNQCYRFEYDQRGNMVVKKTPGTPSGIAGESWFVYDQLNRLVLQQDGNLRSAQRWQYIQYDLLDRPIAKGYINDPTNSGNLSFHVTNAATSSNTTAGVSAWPVLSNYTTELSGQTFYDDYSKVPAALPRTIDATTNGTANTWFSTTYNTTPFYAQQMTQSSMTQGLVTGTNSEVMGSNGGQYLPSVSFYDGNGRVIQTQSINYTTGKDIATSQYDWSGKPLTTLLTHVYVSSSNPQTHMVVSAMTYDPMGRLTMVLKTVNSTINGVAVSSPTSRLVGTTYDELGRLNVKSLGNNIETLTHEYNVQGWLLGINRGYIGGSSSNYFGTELGYDKPGTLAAGTTFANQTFNGNVGGVVWKSKGDGVNRKYDLSYDNVYRLTGAGFLQNTTGAAWDNGFIDFSVTGLAGQPISYDANGNIGGLSQNGFVQGGKQPVDQLTYNYVNGTGNSNQLQYVSDAANVPASTLGDLHYTTAKTTSSVDYTYDANGNTISDVNRSITGITYYPSLNLPQTITTSKGTIQFLYDADGSKLQKKVTENTVTIPSILVNNTLLTNVQTNITTTTNYIKGFVYRTIFYSALSLAPLNTINADVLQFIGAGEGRIRFKPASGTIPGSYVHDYWVRDHLGNIRVGLTDETQQDIYPAATGETSSFTVNGVTGTAQAYEKQYYNFNTQDFIASSSLPWYTSMPGNSTGYQNQNNGGIPTNAVDPFSNTTGTNANVFQLCGNILNNPSGDRFGLGITLKVMSGDQVSIYGTSFWHNTADLTTQTAYPVSAVIASLLGMFGTSSAVTTGGHGALDGSAFNTGSSTPTSTLLSPMLSNSPALSGLNTAPYAGINWIIFDDQFKPISVGFDPVSGITDNIKLHKPGTGGIPSSITIPKNGYIFIYCSNQSNVNVYFDNLQVVQTRGPLLEETHYYPTGLAMAGISDRAWNKTPNNNHYQGKELQNQEWNNGSGLEEYDFSARFYDPQLGRWNTQDPAGQFVNPYVGMANNWMSGTDPDGKAFLVDDVVVAAFGFVVGFAEDKMAGGSTGDAIKSGLIDAAIVEVAYLTLGGGLSAGGDNSATAVAKMAVPFASSFTATSAFTYMQNYDQIKNSTASRQIALIAGYNATSAISAGFSSDYMQKNVDQWAFIPKFLRGAGDDSWNAGAFSQGLGGAISNAANNILQNGGGWTANTGFSAVAGFTSSYAGQVAHNEASSAFPKGTGNDANPGSDKYRYYSLTSIEKNLAGNIASGLTQQLIGNWASQYGSKNGYDNVGSPDTGQFISEGHSWWGAWLNGLGGFQSDMYNDAH